MKLSLLLRQHCSHLGRQGSCDGDVDKHCLLGPPQSRAFLSPHS